MRLTLRSDAFEDDGALPIRYTCDGENLSPPLSWGNVPEGTKTFAIVMDDLDVRGRIFCHWLVFNIDGEVQDLGEGLPRTQQLPHHRGTQGRNDFSDIGYRGPCPPPNGGHRYRISLYALDTTIDAKPGTTRAHLFDVMEGRQLGFAHLTGTYHRNRH